MSEVQHALGTRLTLDIWHPGCWAIDATEKVGGGVLAHAIYHSPKSDASPTSVNGLFTAFGESSAEVDALLEEISRSENAGDVLDLQQRFGRERDAPGNAVREFFLEYDPNDMVCPTLLKHGLVHSAPVRIEGGRETWQVCFTGDRSNLEDALDGVREDACAEVTVQSIHSGEWEGESARHHRLDTLTSAQREAFEYAQEAGYYSWPRECRPANWPRVSVSRRRHCSNISGRRKQSYSTPSNERRGRLSPGGQEPSETLPSDYRPGSKKCVRFPFTQSAVEIGEPFGSVRDVLIDRDIFRQIELCLFANPRQHLYLVGSSVLSVKLPGVFDHRGIVTPDGDAVVEFLEHELELVAVDCIDFVFSFVRN